MFENDRSESSVGELREWFRGRVFNRMPLAMIVADREGRIEAANAQSQALFGYAEVELLGQSVDKLVPTPLREMHQSLRERFNADPEIRPMGSGRDLLGLRRDGSTVPVEIALHPMQTRQGIMMLATIVDITERKHHVEQLRVMLEEKRLLLRELHHRVKNNLQMIDSLLDLQIGRVQDAQAAALILDSRNRIRAMSLVHRQLYLSDDFARVDIQGFLDALLPALSEAYAPHTEGITLVTDAHRVRLPIGAAIPCGLVVNELVTNAYKHAFPDGRSGSIWVELASESPGAAVLTVANDGEPIAADFDPERTETIGMRLVALLATQLRGRLEILRGARTQFRIAFQYGED